MKMQFLRALALGVPMLLSGNNVTAQSGIESAVPYERPALMTDEARKSITIGLASAGPRLVGVGERGVILVSDDHGSSWRQVPSPVSITLTAVDFVNRKLGWAVGHAGVILHTKDGGETWVKQFDGVRAAEAIAERVSEATAGMSEDEARSLRDYADYMVQDGPDKPFLDVLFETEDSGVVIGAFGLAFRTRDGGETWEPWFERIDNPEMLHLYKLSTNGKGLAIVGERGLFLTAKDFEGHFVSHITPYDGTFFTVAPASAGKWVLAGLRGNAFISSATGSNYEQLSLESQASLNGSLALADGTVFLVDQGGNVYRVDAQEGELKPLRLNSLPPLADLVPSGDGTLIAASYRGPIKLDNSGLRAEMGEQQ